MAITVALNSTLPHSNTKLVSKVHKLCQGQWLGQNIYRLFYHWNILNTENVLLHHVLDIVISHLNVLRPVVKHRILGELYTTLIVTVDDCGF